MHCDSVELSLHEKYYTNFKPFIASWILVLLAKKLEASVSLINSWENLDNCNKMGYKSFHQLVKYGLL